MESPCYRCGTPVEEQTPFCPSCGAPQIKVAAPNQPSTPPLPPGTPSSIEPPALPLHFVHATPIDWKKFLRSALPLSLLAGFGVAYANLLGLIIFFALIAITVVRYRRYHPVPLSASQGARMGALAGLLGFIVFLALVVFSVLANPDELRRQVAAAVNQRLANNSDPHLQQFAQWATTTQGLVFFAIIGGLFSLVLCIILSGAVGAIAASLSGSKNRR